MQILIIDHDEANLALFGPMLETRDGRAAPAWRAGHDPAAAVAGVPPMLAEAV